MNELRRKIDAQVNKAKLYSEVFDDDERVDEIISAILQALPEVERLDAKEVTLHEWTSMVGKMDYRDKVRAILLEAKENK